VSPLTRLRELRDTDPGYDRGVWKKIAESGWTGLLVSEAHGGLQLGLGAAAAVAREVGKNPLPEPFLATAIHAVALLEAMPESPLRNQLLAALAEGQCIAGVAWQEAPGASARRAHTVAERDGDNAVISGRKQWVYPAAADGWLVHCTGDAGGIYWVAAGAAGL